MKPDCVEADEIWAFIGSKGRNVPEGHEDDVNYGSVWTWVAILIAAAVVIFYLLKS